MANLKITTDEKGIVFDNGREAIRKGLNSVHYCFIGGDTLVFKNAYDKETIDSTGLANLTLNGETLTVDNYDAKLKEALFVEGSDSGVTLPIEIADVDGLEEALEDKADLINGIIPSSQLPSYVDDVIDGELISSTVFNDMNGVSVTPESGKIYVDVNANKSYRWSGTVYASLGSGIALGETSSTAYRGDRGKIAYDHSGITGNPHSTTKSDVGLGNVDNTSDINKPISTATQQAIDNISTNARNFTRNFRNWEFANATLDFIDDNTVTINLSGAQNGAINTKYIRRNGDCIYAINVKTTQVASIYIGIRATVLLSTSHPQYFVSYDNVGGYAFFDLPANFDDRIILYANHTYEVNHTWYVGILYDAAKGSSIELSYPQLLKANKYTDWLQAPEDLIDLSNAVQNVQIGAQNLILGSDFEFGMSDSSVVNGSSLSRVTGGYHGDYCVRVATPVTAESGYAWQNLPTISGKRYTISCYVKADSNISNASFRILNSSWGIVLSKSIDITTDWTRVELTFVATGTSMKMVLLKSSVTFYIDCVQLEEGDKATSWALSPDEKKNNITYSTTEQWTGDYWIDGKKIYQKTIDLAPLPNATSKQVPTNISNLHRVIDMKGYHFSTGNVGLPLIHSDSTDNVNEVSITMLGTNILIRVGVDRSNFTESYVTLYYTCTNR